jgi:hypothetical protein
MLHREALVRTDVSEELSASFIRVTRIGELGTMLAVTSRRRTLQTCGTYYLRLVYLLKCRRKQRLTLAFNLCNEEALFPSERHELSY